MGAGNVNKTRTRLLAKAILVSASTCLALASVGSLTPSAFAGTKTISGKLRAVNDRVLTIEQKKLLDTTSVDVALDNHTKVTGELVPGMMIKVKFREETGFAGAASGDSSAEKSGSVRRIAVQVKTWPEYSSRRDRKAAPDTQR